MYSNNSASAYNHDKQDIGSPVEVHNLDGIFLNDLDRLTRTHVQTQFEIICVTAGIGVHVINGEQYAIKAGSICAALPGQKHQLIAEPGLQGYMLCLNPGYMYKTIDSYQVSDESILYHFFCRHGRLDMETEQIAHVVCVMEKLGKELSHYLLLRNEIVTNYLKIVLLYIRRALAQTIHPEELLGGNPLLKKFLLLLENNFRDRLSVSDYARHLFITPNHLNNMIKKTSGHSAGYHIRQRIIHEAKKKLTYSGASLKEIAAHLGFESSAHFSKFFKETAGMRFIDYKKEVHHQTVPST